MARLKRIINYVGISCPLNVLLALLIMTIAMSCGRSKTGKNGGPTPQKADVTRNSSKYQLEIQGLGENNFVSTANKFNLKIKKEVGKIESEETKDFQVVVTTITGDAKIGELNSNQTITFAPTENMDGAIVKEIQVAPGTLESELKLDLQYQAKNVSEAAQTIKVKPIVVRKFKLAVDRNTIHDGSTDFTISISLTGIGELQEANVAELALKIERDQGSLATINSISKGNYAFKEEANKLTILADKKVATKKLNIIPNQDQKAMFKLTLVDKTGPISNTETIDWNNGIELEVIKLAYNLTTQQIEYQIKNKGAAPTAQVDLTWRRTEGTTVKLDDNQQGSKALVLDGSNNKEQMGSLLVEWGTDTSAKFEFELKSNAIGVYKRELPLSQTGFSIKLALENAGLTTLVGEAQKNIKLIFTALKQLSKENLQSISLDYVAMHGALVISPKLEAVKGKNLHDLLGITSLANGATAALELTIINNGKPEVLFKEIKLQGTGHEDTNKIAQIHWKGEVKMKLESKDDLTQLQGDKGRVVSLKFTNESAFDLKKEALEKIKVKLSNLSAGASVSCAHHLIEDIRTTLWDLLGTQLDAGQTIDKDLTIAPGTNLAVDFVLGLEGENIPVAEHDPIPVNWKATEIKVKVQGHNGSSAVDLTQLHGKGGKQFPIRFTNDSGSDLQEEDLKKVVIELRDLPAGVILKLGESIIESEKTTLWDINPIVFRRGKSFDRTFTIEPRVLTSVGFTLELAGENKERINQSVEVRWEQGKGEPEVKIVDANRKLPVYRDRKKFKFKLGFNNEGTVDLDAIDLKNIKLEISGEHKPNTIAFKRKRKLESGETTLADLFNSLKAGATEEVEFTIDPGMAASLDFTVGLINSSSLDTKRVITWHRKLELEFITPKVDTFTFTGTKGYLLELKNKEDEINSDDLTIELIANKGAKFKLGDEVVGEAGTKLTNVIKQKHKQAINISKDGTIGIMITSDNTPDKTESTIKIVIKYHGRSVAIRILNWKSN